MKIQLIGHASLLIETQDCRFLVDPVFVDPHGEGIEEIYPRREVLIDRIPEYDAMIISHRHFDHFDIETLAKLPKDVPVFIPEDALMQGCLEQLGYTHIQPLADFREVTLGGTRLLTTGSDAFVQEFGLVFSDSSGVLWNQVDSVINAKTIESLLARYGRIDLMLAMWQPMLEFNYQVHQSLEFPFAAYGDLLTGIGMLAPGALAPGANGFRYCGEASWLNRVVFPVTRERFCHDVVEACTALEDHVFVLDPGDGLLLDNGHTTPLPEQATYIRRTGTDDSPLRFEPVRLDAHFVDTNPDGYDADAVEAAVTAEIERDLPVFLREHSAAFAACRHWRMIYRLEVAFADHNHVWTVDFTENPPNVRRGDCPLANFFSYITGSALFGIMNGLKGWDYAVLGGFYRMHHKIYVVTPHGLVRPNFIEFKDPLSLRFAYEDVLEATLVNQINRHRQA